MMLETHNSVISLDPTPDDIAEAVAGLTEVGEAYIILNAEPDRYIQASGTIAEGFILERREGSAGEHYRADRRVEHAELVRILTVYLQDPPAWNATGWHRIRVDQERPTA